MSGKPYSLGKQLVVAMTLALGATSVAQADDNSMNPFIGDSYRYFNGGHNLGEAGNFGPAFSISPADPLWRQSHPNGLSERDLQALSSSGLSAAAEQLNRPLVASAAADPLWRKGHPNGLAEGELQALSSSTLGRWGASSASATAVSAAGDQAVAAQIPGSQTFLARLARFLNSESGTQATN